MAPRRKKTARRLTARVKVWLEVEGDYVFGLGIARILEAVDRSGSIKGAAEEVGKSYRHVWSRIKEAEAALGEALVDASVGGAGRRSVVTPRGLELVREFLALRADVFAFVEDEFEARFR